MILLNGNELVTDSDYGTSIKYPGKRVPKLLVKRTLTSFSLTPNPDCKEVQDAFYKSIEEADKFWKSYTKEKISMSKLTTEELERLIVKTTYFVDDALTICIATTETGFKVVGKSSPIDPKNFDPKLGKQYSFDDAVRQLWELEGYKRKGNKVAE